MSYFFRSISRGLWFSVLALVTGVLAACGGGGDNNENSGLRTIYGTVIVGKPLANATLTIICASGSGATTTNVNGTYSLAFVFTPPCMITATSGSTVLHAPAIGPGQYNLSAFTELMINYIAGQLGITANQLIAGITNQAAVQQALSNPSVIQNAQIAIANIIQQTYGVAITTSFLTTPITIGQGLDLQLDQLATITGQIHGVPVAGLVNGMPPSALATHAIQQGALAPLTGGPTGGTGGTPGS